MPRDRCLSDNELLAYVQGRLAEPALDEAANHLDHCPRCEEGARRLDALGHTLQDALGGSDELAADALPGQVGDYEVLGLLGWGGMGVVYRARHRQLGRVVALKMLRGADLAGADARRRFRAEAAAVARLQHPHIVQVFEVGESTTVAGQPQPYFTLEYVEGGNLADRLSSRPQAPGQAALWLETIADAVYHAHQNGVVHRDLKPSNVLLTACGEVKVCDFGVAKLLAGTNGRTRTGAVLGTPEYMAPEQGQGRQDEVGPAADIYALGAILYDMLTGHPPFQGATAVETLLLAQTVDAIPPRRLQPGVPRDLETICLKCLEKSPARRYPTAQALADDLRRFRAGEPVRARPLSRVGRAWRWCRRSPALALALLTAVLALLGGTGASWWFAIQARDEAEQARASARRAADRAYLSDLRLAQSAWEDALPDRVVELLDAQRPEHTAGLDLRGFEWHYWWRLSHPQQRVLNHGVAPRAVAYSPRGDRLATAGGDGLVRVWDDRDQLLLTLPGHEGPGYAVAYSSDGERIASGGADKKVRVWDALRGGPALLTLSGHEHDVRAVAFSPDRGRIASACRDGTAKVWDADTGRCLFTFRGHARPVYGVVFGPDGRQVASAGADGTVKVWPVDGKGPILTLYGATGELYAVVISPDGDRVAAAGADHKARIWDVRSGHGVPLTLEGHALTVWGVAFGPRGDRLATAADDRTVKVWDAREGGPALLTLPGHGRTVWGVAFRPDGGQIASAGNDGSVRLWDAGRGAEPSPLTGHRSQVTSVAVSPDGRRLASAGGDWDPVASRYVNGELKVWELDTGRVLFELRGHADGVTAATFSPDGRYLASASGSWDEDGRRYAAGEVKLWDAQTGAELGTWRGHGGAVLCLAFSPDGRQLASAGFDRVVRVRSVPDGGDVLGLEGHTDLVTGVAFTPDGRRLVSAGFDGHARIWDLRTGATVRTMDGGTMVSSVAISRDGRRLALSGYGDRQLTLWDLEAGRLLQTLKGHADSVTSVAFSPEMTRLAAGGEDGTVRLWDLNSGQEILVLKGQTSVVRGVAFCRDGRRIVSGGWDRTVRVWDARPCVALPGDPVPQ
jgi:WD40 repeat protein